MKQTILIVEDNRKLAHLFQEALSGNFDTIIVSSIFEAKQYLEKVNGILLDLQLPDGEGIELIAPARAKNPSCVIIVVTAYGTVQKAVEALRLGAADFLEKPVDLEALLRRFEDLMPRSAEKGIVAESAGMKEVLALAEKVAHTSFPVLICGETGTGKEVVARYIHDHSARQGFIALNCASVPVELADSLLFGHKKGSFTGATDRGKGLVESADKGSLFLDEIGELPLALQPKLLRFLDSGSYLPLGEEQERKSGARILAATNRDLEKMVKKGEFREDLFFRLSAFPIEIPPLRDRKDDIIPLANQHLGILSVTLNKPLVLSQEAVNTLCQYGFPGNVRELFNILDRAAVISDGVITGSLIRKYIKTDDQKRESCGNFWKETRIEASKKERELIKAALEASGGNKAAAARSLNISYKTLLNKMKKLEL